MKFPDRTTIDGGWYKVDMLYVREDKDSITVTLDEDSLVINRRHPGYWLAMLLMPFRVIRDRLR